jgi:DNA-binding transcriptional LysR family regulator
MRANDSDALRDAALAGLGSIALVRDGGLITVPPNGNGFSPGPERPIWDIEQVVSPKVKAFLAFLAQRFGHPAYWDLP